MSSTLQPLDERGMLSGADSVVGLGPMPITARVLLLTAAWQVPQRQDPSEHLRILLPRRRALRTVREPTHHVLTVVQRDLIDRNVTEGDPAYVDLGKLSQPALIRRGVLDRHMVRIELVQLPVCPLLAKLRERWHLGLVVAYQLAAG